MEWSLPTRNSPYPRRRTMVSVRRMISRMTPNETRPRSPKLPGDNAKHAGAWYRYYAGFSADSVRDIVSELKVWPDQLVADPWNGSGTTTAVADEPGIPSCGGDINPAMVVIAKAGPRHS